MGQFLLRRLIRTIVVLWGVSTIVFFVTRLSGDPITLILPPDAPAAEIQRVRDRYGLNDPLPVQYAVFFGRAAHGGVSHLVMPTIALGTFAMASIARLTRSAMLETMGREFIRTARAKGLAPRVVTLAHGFRNALIPVVTIMGLQFGALLGGAVVTETIFSWPGMGRLAIDAIRNRDYPVVQATVFLAAVAFVLVNLATDLLYGRLDPRIRNA